MALRGSSRPEVRPALAAGCTRENARELCQLRFYFLSVQSENVLYLFRGTHESEISVLLNLSVLAIS